MAPHSRPSRSDPGRGAGPEGERLTLDPAAHRDHDAQLLPPDPLDTNVEITKRSASQRLLGTRAALAAAIAGLGALAAGVTGADTITLAIGLTAAAAAAAAAGAVYGVRPEGLDTRMSRTDLATMTADRKGKR